MLDVLILGIVIGNGNILALVSCSKPSALFWDADSNGIPHALSQGHLEVVPCQWFLSSHCIKIYCHEFDKHKMVFHFARVGYS